MDDPSIKKRLIDLGTDEHEYDEVQDLPEESNNQQQPPAKPPHSKQHKIDNNNTAKAAAAEAAEELPPELPPPKQKGISSKNKQKQKQKSNTKSKIPRSPSLASSLSSLASSLHSGISGVANSSSSNNNNNNNNNTSIPPQTPPLPVNYQQQNKTKHLNGGDTANVVNTPATSSTSSNNNNNNNCNNNANNLSSNSNNNNNNNNSNNNNNIMGGGVQLSQQTINGGGGVAGQQPQRGSLNLSAAAAAATSATRRPQIQITPIAETPPTSISLAAAATSSASPQKNFQYLTLTVHKDANGYGMKVSGDNPVFVESVKPYGAAQIAGLVAGDMILKVNGQEVRSEKHPTVVSLIKASTIVELAVKRSQKIARPTSVGIVPSTPVLSGRDRTASITGPQPVDSIKRREMETYKIQTLQKMLEEEKLNLEKLKGDTNNPSYKLSEANIRKLREQLRQVGAEVLGQTPHNMSHIKHRRVVSSPDNMHPRHPDRLIKTTSGSWELVEKDDEATPPGTPPPPYLTTSSMSVPEDPNESGGGGIFVESHNFTPLAGAATPQSAAIHSTRIQAAQSSDTQKHIISMEDESISDQEEQFIDENGPFNNLPRLLESENVAFLAVFLNYVLSNSEPAPLLFYLITELYKEGSAKDMRKWAYEIHSTFLVPRAPLSWYRQDESLAREVDYVLQDEFDKVEILSTVFFRSRKRAKELITEQLRDFQQKRTAGLGTIYGPTDAQLAEAKSDKQREHIVDVTLMCKLQILIEEYEKDLPAEDPRKLALCSALSTVIHRIFNTRSHTTNSIVDRVHHFVSREKSFKSRLMGKNRKMIVRGHPLVLRQYYEVTHCNHCQTIIWGVSPQGYHCTDCKLNIHRPCSKILDENCPGPLPQAKRNAHKDNKFDKLMGKIRTRASTDFIAAERRTRNEEDADSDFFNERLHNTSLQRQPSDRRPDASVQLRTNGNASANSSALSSSDLQSSFHAASGNESASGNAVDGSAAGGMLPPGSLAGAAGQGSDLNAQDAANDSKELRRERYQQQQTKSAPVNRSESYRDRITTKRNRNSRRKTSDPSLTSRQNDDPSDLGLSNSNYTASSNSSLSSGGGSESPSTSLEQVAGGAAAAAAGSNAAAANAWHHQQHPYGVHHAHQHIHQDSFHSSAGSNNSSSWAGQQARAWNFESDEEDDFSAADWSSKVAAEMLAALTDAEKKRQEIINEIYQTERSHVRTLKLLDRLFYGPLCDSNLLSTDHLMLLFPPALHSLRDLHSNFEQQLKQRRIDHNHIVSHIGDLIASMFDGESGERLCRDAAEFCARQQIALEALKEKRRKDEQLQKLLSKSESHKACRRLQLKDLLPTVLQRLTKYPLLFETLYKVTIRVVPENTTEAEALKRAVESSKKILVEVNQAVKTAEDAHKLKNIQRKLDKSAFKGDEFFENLDLTQYRLIYDGNLTMKKNPSVQLHSLLFENMIVLLTKQDDKYSLKYLHAAPGANNKPIGVSPIMNIDSDTLVRQEAADKNSFFLIKTKSSQMLELRASSSSECKTWFKHISDAAEQYKPRSKSHTNSHEQVDDPAIATIPHSTTKESLEMTPDRAPPMMATATVTTTPLAPMLPMATVTPAAGANVSGSQGNDSYNDVQLRNGRRESTPTMGDNGGYYNLSHSGSKQRLSHNELSSSASSATLSTAVGRTMSTRSCGENSNYANMDSNGVTLRHTQSARQAAAAAAAAASSASPNGQVGDGDGTVTYSLIGGPSKRDSASIVCSNNSNNTRTLLMQSPLVEPTAIHISISPAHTAEPVLTPNERLRRLDAAIRDGLHEKQKIICDMFRLPVEHFNEIVDIAAMPEAPKDSADIALAAYDQVQTLTKVLNDYMQVTPEQQISAVSTAVCDHCHEKQQQKQATNAAASVPTAMAGTQQSAARADTPPPPLPPPNKQQPAQQTPAKSMPKMQTPAPPLEESSVNIHEDDDGYCEIDELRLPAIPMAKTATAAIAAAATPLAPFKVPLSPAVAAATPPSTPTAGAGTATTAAATATPPTTSTSTPELVKRQSTISADSIPEESADEVSKALGDEEQQQQKSVSTTADDDSNAAAPTDKSDEKQTDDTTAESEAVHVTESAEAASASASAAAAAAEVEAELGVAVAEPQRMKSADTLEDDSTMSSDFIEINDVYDTLAALNKAQATLSMIDSSTQTARTALPLSLMNGSKGTNSAAGASCGPNRIQHASSLEPSVPCYALSSIVSALNEQISLLLPKINERDMERERLRKENLHLRELLSAMHERQRVEAKGETPTDIKTILNAADEAFDDEIDGASTTSLTPTPTPLPSTPTALTNEASAAAATTVKAGN